MSVVQLTFVTAANMLGAGIIMLPTKLAEVGTISIISWIITSLGSLALAMAFARCGMFTTKPGGMGGYSEYAFGRIGHFMANYAYSVSIVIANVAIAITQSVTAPVSLEQPLRRFRRVYIRSLYCGLQRPSTSAVPGIRAS